MVKEYLLNELAFDSGYERNIIRARKSAFQKRKESNTKKQKIRKSKIL